MKSLVIAESDVKKFVWPTVAAGLGCGASTGMEVLQSPLHPFGAF